MNLLRRVFSEKEATTSPCEASSGADFVATTALVLRLRNCRLVRGGRLLPAGTEDLYVRGGRVLDPAALFYDEKRVADVEIECGGLVVAPGLIDLQREICGGASDAANLAFDASWLQLSVVWRRCRRRSAPVEAEFGML